MSFRDTMKQYGGLDAETLVLDGDTQRNVVVITLMLAILFAMLPQLPLAPAPPPPRVESAERAAQSQEARTEKLLAENRSLAAQVATLEEKSIRHEAALEELARARSELETLSAKIQDLTKPGTPKGQDPVSAQSTAEERSRRIDQIETRQREAAAALAAPAEKPEATPKKAAGGLYFSSPQAVSDLLCSGQVNLFVKVENGPLFEIRCKDGVLNLAQGTLPEDFFGGWIERDMIPENVVRAFEKYTTLSTRKRVFIVSLAPGLAQSVQALGLEHGVMVDSQSRVNALN